MSRFPRSLLARAFLTSVGVLALVITLLATVVGFLLDRQPVPFPWEGLEAEVEAIHRSMRFDPQGRLLSLSLPTDATQAYDTLQKDLAFQVLASDGTELFSSDAGPALGVLRKLPFPAPDGLTRIADSHVPMQVLSSSITEPGRSFVVRVARSERLISKVRTAGGRLTINAVSLAALVALLICAPIVYLVAKRALKPLRDVSAAAMAIDTRNLTRRLDGTRLPSELVPLIEAFNNALERLEKGFRVQQEFLAAAAHELKTPLALIRGEIEMGSAPNRDIVLRDVDFMARQIHQLLHLAEVSEPQNFVMRQLDVAAVMEEAATYANRLAANSGVTVDLVRDCDVLMLSADRGALLVLAKNLLENAINHSPAGGVVTIRLDASSMSVRDVGPGVAPEEVSKLFTRFWRSPAASHEGAGLGLSICKEIAVAHGWSLEYRAPISGRGADFLLRFSAPTSS